MSTPTVFDAGQFLKLNGAALGEYVDAVNAAGLLGVSSSTIGPLMETLNDMDFIRAFYVLAWAARVQLAGVSDRCIAILSRQGLSGGEQLSVLRLLATAQDCRPSHVAAIESIRLHDAFGVIPEQLNILKARIAKHT